MAKLLDGRQRLFVQEYLVDLCGKEAAIRAGYAPRSAKYRASWLLKRPHIQAAVEDAMAARARTIGVTAERVLAEIAVVAFSDLQDHIELEDGEARAKDFKDMPPGASRALESIADTRDAKGAGRVSVKLHDKMKALDMLAKHLGLCRDQVNVSGSVDTELTVKVVKV